MDRIASLRRADTRAQLIEIRLESGEAIRVHDRRLDCPWLAGGQPVDDGRLGELRRWAAADAAERRALRLLARRGRSRAELQSRLQEWGVDPESAGELLDRLAAAGAVDDAALASSLAEHRRESGHGRLRVQADLTRLGVDRGDVAAAVDAGGDSEQERARCRAELERRFGDRPRDRRGLARAASHLARRGFDADTVAEALGLDADV